MGKKKFKKQIESQEEVISIHEEKIKLELEKDVPNYGLIHHWESEIKAAIKNIARAEKRL